MQKSHIVPKEWAEYQGVIIDQTSMEKAKELWGEPAYESTDRNFTVYQYEDYDVLGIDQVVQYIEIRNKNVQGALGDLDIHIGDQFEEVYAKLPERHIIKVQAESFRELRDEGFNIYSIEGKDARDRTIRNILITLGDNVVVRLYFNERDLLYRIIIAKGNIMK